MRNFLSKSMLLLTAMLLSFTTFSQFRDPTTRACSPIATKNGVSLNRQAKVLPGGANAEAMPSFITVNVDGKLAPQTNNLCNNVILDGSFETGGIPSTIWSQTSTNGGTPLCDVPGCGTGGGTAGPRTGAIWAWFGGWAAVENASLSQTVTIASGSTANLNFYMWVGAVATPFNTTLTVKVDGTIVQTYTEPAVAETGYTLRTVNLSAYANGAAHVIRFEYTEPTSGTGNWSVDDVTLDVCTTGPVADLAITKTDGTSTYTAGGTTTYTIAATNLGTDPVTGATVTDNFPAAITTANWTAVYAGGATGPASGSGNINATVNLPVSGTATFTAVCNISGAATGTLSNTATVAVPGGTTDPVSTNNSATDLDFPPGGGPVTITATAGTPGPTPYLTVKDAFDAINAGTHQGAITVNVNTSTTETASAVLNRTGTGAAIYTSVLVRPTADGLTVTGNIASTAVIKLNTATNVTIDGDNPNTAGTNRNLSIVNTATTAPNIVWIGGNSGAAATNIVLKNCILTNGASVSSGVVTSLATTIGTAGYFNNVTIQNNNISNSYIANYNIAVVAAGNGSGLLVTGNDFNTSGATQNRLVGVYVQGVDGATISNNNIGNMANTADAANLSGIWFATGVVNSIISGNTISTFSGAAGAPRGIYISTGVAAANINITGNAISALSTASTATVTGIAVAAATNGITIQKNKITNIKNTNTSGFGANGIQLSSTLTTANNVTVYNNFVSDVTGVGFTLRSVADNGYGIAISAGGGYNLYYNTVLMNTSQANAGYPAALNVFATGTNNTLDIRNNIFANTQTSGGTEHFAIQSSATAARYLDINYNDYYTTGPNLGYLGSLRANLAAWQTATAKDANSISTQPYFVSATDLHLIPGSNCAIDAKGTPIAAVTDDIDAQTRNAATPDMGADEFTLPAAPAISYTGSPYCSNAGTATVTQTGATGGTYSSTAGLTINATTGDVTLATSTAGTYTVTYTVAAAGSCALQTTTTSITITAAPSATISYTASPYCSSAGTATVTRTGTAGGTYSAAPAGLTLNAANGDITLATSTAGTYTVTYTVAASGGCALYTTTTSITVSAAPSATISYTASPYCSNAGTATVTQTGTGGGTYSATPAGLNINSTTGTITLASSTPNTYTVTYTVAASGGCPVYTTTTPVTVIFCGGIVTVTATAGTPGPTPYNSVREAFDAINLGTHQGDIIVNINTNTNEGTTPAVINASGAGAAVYTSILVHPTADNLSIAGGVTPTTRCVIELNGADNVTIDGDNPNTPGTNRNLTVTLTGTTASIGLIWFKTASATNGCLNNTVQNCILRGQDQVNTTIGILTGSGTFGGAAQTGNNGNSILNNAFSKTQNGIYLFGFGTTPFDANWNISNNTFGSTVAADKHIFRGMILQNASNFTINNNTIAGIASTATSAANMTGIQIASGALGGTISGNKISDVKQNNPVGFGAEGITLGSTSVPSNINVYNNFISDIAGQGWLGTSTPTNGFSVSDNGNGIAVVAGGGYGIYYNTVHMNTNQVNDGNPAALLVNGPTTAATLNIRDNIFTNSQTVGTNRRAFISAATAATYQDINYNDYYSAGPNLAFLGTNLATIAAIRTATGKDVNSISAAPVFVSATDLHLAAIGNCALENQGTPITTPAITTDIDGATRNASTPDIGADEFTATQPTATISYPGTPYCSTVVTAPVTRTGTAGGVYTAAPLGLTIDAATGTVTPNTSTPGIYTVTYTIAAVGGCPTFTTTTSITITLAPNAIIFYANTPYCTSGGTATVSQFGTTGGTYSAAPAGLSINTTTGAVTLATSTPGTYTVTYTMAASGGCGVTITTTTITITAAPSATIAYTGSPYCSNAGTATVTRTGTAGGTYSSTAGLTLNATTGAVTLGTSTPGTYTVTYTVAASGGCAVFTTTTTITITQLPAATISYAGSPYCSNAGVATVTRTGTAGGTYSSTAGLIINSTSGDVTLATSTAGTYTVTYTIAAGGGCGAVTATTTITITTLPAATINYAGSPYCQNAGTATVTRTGTAGGTYSATPAGLTINATTGTVTLGTSTPGTYTVSYTLAAGGGCGAVTATASITVSSLSVDPTGTTASSSTLCGPGNVTLSVTGGSLGTGASWKWYTGSCGGTVVGTGATLTIAVNATTTYYVRAEGTCNTTACTTATITVNTQPTISIAASSTSILPGQTTTLTATVAPAGTPIQWYRNGTVVPGATNTTLVVNIDGLGDYTARATTTLGCTALSNVITIATTATTQLFISPNPNNGLFKVRYYTNAQQLGFVRHLVMFAENGQKVFDQTYPITAPYSSMNVDARRLPKGIYIVMLTDAFGKDVLATGKVVIQ